MEDTEKKGEDAPVGRPMCFYMLIVPDEPPLAYEYWWVESRLFHKRESPSPKLSIHAHKWFEELREQMDGLKAYIEEHKGKRFASRADQLMYGSLLENMRDLLAKLLKAVQGADPSPR